MSHGEAPPSPYTWGFFGQFGFASSAQVPDPREVLDLQIRLGSREAVLFSLTSFLGRLPAGPFEWIGNFLMGNLLVVWSVSES